jgi:NB-ARC domain
VATLKASTPGLLRIKQRRSERGWTIDDPQWLVVASQQLLPQVEWYEGGPFAPGISEATWKRFLAGRPVATPTFKIFCHLLDLPWEDVVDRPPDAVQRLQSPQSPTFSPIPDLTTFYGRTAELAALSQAITQDCRILTLWGMGGIGKTALAVKLVEQVESQFERVVWRSLQTNPPLDKLLADLLKVLDPSLSFPANPSLEDLVSRFLNHLQNSRSLLVLDGWEAILGGQRGGQSNPKYIFYEDLIQRISKTRHQSCLVIISREKPEITLRLESCTSGIKVRQIFGLGDAAHDLLKDKNLRDEPDARLDLIQLYRGNPLALNIVAAFIQDFFGGSIRQALQTGTLVGRELVDHVISESIQRVSDVERSLLYTLAHSPFPLPLDALKADLAELSYSELLEALSSLDRRCLIEKASDNTQVLFTLQPLVTKYIIRKLRR